MIDARSPDTRPRKPTARQYLTDPGLVDRAWDREVEIAKIAAREMER